jgi:hypothetical protein
MRTDEMTFLQLVEPLEGLSRGFFAQLIGGVMSPPLICKFRALTAVVFAILVIGASVLSCSLVAFHVLNLKSSLP